MNNDRDTPERLTPVTPLSPEARLRLARQRLVEIAHPPADAPRRPSDGLMNRLGSPLGLAVGAVAVGIGLTAVARTAAGRSLVKVAGRGALTAARVLILPAVARSVSQIGTRQGGG